MPLRPSKNNVIGGSRQQITIRTKGKNYLDVENMIRRFGALYGMIGRVFHENTSTQKLVYHFNTIQMTDTMSYFLPKFGVTQHIFGPIYVTGLHSRILIKFSSHNFSSLMILLKPILCIKIFVSLIGTPYPLYFNVVFRFYFMIIAKSDFSFLFFRQQPKSASFFLWG